MFHLEAPSRRHGNTMDQLSTTYNLFSLVPRPLPVFNDTRKKREGLVREVTCTSFRWKGGTWWKGDYRAWAGDLFACSACSTVPIVPGTGIATGRRVAIAALQ